MPTLLESQAVPVKRFLMHTIIPSIEFDDSTWLLYVMCFNIPEGSCFEWATIVQMFLYRIVIYKEKLESGCNQLIDAAYIRNLMRRISFIKGCGADRR